MNQIASDQCASTVGAKATTKVGLSFYSSSGSESTLYELENLSIDAKCKNCAKPGCDWTRLGASAAWLSVWVNQALTGPDLECQQPCCLYGRNLGCDWTKLGVGKSGRDARVSVVSPGCLTGSSWQDHHKGKGGLKLRLKDKSGPWNASKRAEEGLSSQVEARPDELRLAGPSWFSDFLLARAQQGKEGLGGPGPQVR